jgi:EmrB/QacA subfamily drug resistance transporter
MDERHRRLAVLGVMLSIFLAAMESTVVATAMPRVVASLGGLEIYSWVFSGFLLTSTVTMPVWGRLSDLYGRRRVFLGGLTIFLAGSALSGLAQNMVELIAFRMLQGLGAGSLMTIGMTIVGELFALERRAKMQGYISGVWGVASLCGPLIGGVLTDHASWRWVFYINLPFGAVAMGLIGAGLRDRPRDGRRPALDYPGFVLFSVGVSALLVGVLEAGRVARWTGADVLGPLVLAVAALAAFVRVERRATEPIVPLRLFRVRMVLAASVTGFLAGMAMFGAISFVPLFLQSVSGMSATAAGVVLIPFVLGWVAMSIVSARLVLRIGYRIVVAAGMADADRRAERGDAAGPRLGDVDDPVLPDARRRRRAVGDGHGDGVAAGPGLQPCRGAARRVRHRLARVPGGLAVVQPGAGRPRARPGPGRRSPGADTRGGIEYGG